MHTFFLNSGVIGLYNLLHNKIIVIVAIIYFGLCTFILYKYGIDTNGEASKYIEDAHRIINGEKLRIGFFSTFYLVYSLLVSFFIYFSLSLKSIACIQILFSFLAACCIYKILFDITNDEKISFAAFIIYLLCYPVQKWIFYLYTESLHASLTVIGLYFFYCVFQKKETKRWWMFLLILLLITFSRPVGIIFLLTVFIVWVIKLYKSNQRIAYFLVGSSFIILCICLMQSQFTLYFNPDSLRRMEIICQVPQANSDVAYKEYNKEGLASFFYVIFSDIGIKTFLLNGFKKLASFYTMARSFYSTGHNIILLATAIMLYPLAITGTFLFRDKKAFYFKTFSIIYILITSAGIFFTCDEWSNRFIVPVLPQIIILSALGFYWLKNKINFQRKG